MRGVTLLLGLSRVVLDHSAFTLRRHLRVVVRRLVFGTSAYLAAVGAIAFMVAALHTVMAAAWGSVPASLVIAGALGIAALAFVLAARSPATWRGRPVRRP